MKQVLTLDTLGDIEGGALRIAVNQAMKLVSQDLDNRPALEKKRTVALVLEWTPEVDNNSSQPRLEKVGFAWHVQTKTPSIGSAGVVMKPQQDGQLYFHSDLPEDPDDETIMDEAERRRRERDGR